MKCALCKKKKNVKIFYNCIVITIKVAMPKFIKYFEIV